MIYVNMKKLELNQIYYNTYKKLLIAYKQITNFSLKKFW